MSGADKILVGFVVWLALFVFVLVFFAGAKMLDDTEKTNDKEGNNV